MTDLQKYGAELTGPSEADFMGQVTQLAEMLGWAWVHFRPAQTTRGWRTPVSGPLGKGWPDLVLVRARDRRLIFAELKTDKAKPTRAQENVMAILNSLTMTGTLGVYLWKPKDWDSIVEVLR